MIDYRGFLLNYINDRWFVALGKLVKDTKKWHFELLLIKEVHWDKLIWQERSANIADFIVLIKDKKGSAWFLNIQDNSVWVSKLDKLQIKEVYNVQTDSYFDQDGFDYLWFDRYGFNKQWIHKNGTSYNDEWYNQQWRNESWFNQKGLFDKTKSKIYMKWGTNMEAVGLIESFNQENSIIFLTGKAWTGKTTLMKDLIDFFKTQGKPPLVLASTGLASVNIWGQTVHSFFGIPIANPYYKDMHLDLKKDKIKTLADSSFIVIDEISMLQANILDCVDHKIRWVLANHFGDDSIKNIPFGGKKILFVWDLFQLPPIVQNDWKAKFGTIYSSEFFFDALSIKNSPYQIIELQENYRQGDDSDFWNILDKIREGIHGQADIDKINTRVFKDITDFGILLTTTNQTADTFNLAKLDGIDKPECRFLSSTNWVFPDSMKKMPDVLEFKEGAQIIMLNNDPYKQWVNGDLGVIQSIDEENSRIQVLINNESFEVEPILFKNIEIKIVDEEITGTDEHGNETKTTKKVLEETIIWTFQQFPMKLARAITIHKSQWLTFDNCCIDMWRWAFANGQTYVALSRCRNLNGIRLKSHITLNDVRTDKRVIDFMQKK